METHNAQKVDSMTPRSQVVSKFFDELNNMNETYAVMNNYKDLPWVIPSDVDITISASLFQSLDKLILGFSQKQSSKIVQKLWHGNLKCAYILAVGERGTVEFIQLDFFVDFSAKGCPKLISHQNLVSGRTSFRNFYIPRPEIELLFTLMRRIFKDDWSSRHCKRIVELAHEISGPQEFPISYKWLGPTFEAALQGDLAKLQRNRMTDWVRLRKTANSILSLRDRIGNFLIQCWRIVFRLRYETGCLAIISGGRLGLNSEIFPGLKDVFHRRFLVDRSILEEKSYVGELVLLSRIFFLKRRKALVLINLESQNKEILSLIARSSKLGLVDKVYYFDALPPIAIESLAVKRVCNVDDIIADIVASQSEKTLAAIARGGTQTSG